MLIALVMETYTQVKTSIAGKAETLWSQTWEICQRKAMIWHGEEIALPKVLQGLEAASEADGNFKLEDLLKAVPQLKEEQAKELLHSASDLLKDENAETGLSEALYRIQMLHEKQGDMKNGVEKLASIFDLIKKGLEMHEEKRVRREYAASEFLNKMGSSPRKPDGTKNDRLADWMHRAPPKDVPCKESSLESGDQAAGGSNLDVQLCAKQPRRPAG